MATYTITAKNQTLGQIEADTAKDALDSFCAERPDDDFGFPRGGLTYDADTRGAVWASQKTDGGRITATLQQ